MASRSTREHENFSWRLVGRTALSHPSTGMYPFRRLATRIFSSSGRSKKPLDASSAPATRSSGTPPRSASRKNPTVSHAALTASTTRADAAGSSPLKADMSIVGTSNPVDMSRA